MCDPAGSRWAAIASSPVTSSVWSDAGAVTFAGVP